VLGAAAGLAFDLVRGRDPAPVVVDATALRDEAAAWLGPRRPDLAARVAATPTPFRLTLLPGDALPSLAWLDRLLARRAFLLLGIGLALGAGALLLSRGRGRAAVVLLGTFAGLCFLVAFALVLAPSLLGRGSDLRAVLVAEGLRALARPVVTRSLLLGAAALFLLVVRARLLRRAVPRGGPVAEPA